MSFLAPLLPVAGMALGGILGGSGQSAPQVSAPQIQTSLPGFNAGGINAQPGANGNYNVTPTDARLGTVGGIQSTFNQQAGDIANLRNQFAPGFSALRQAQIATLNNSRTAALGNLRDNLARRRVLGSSFAQDSLARADQEYQTTAANVQAQTYLQELQASQQLIQQQYTAARGSFQTGLDEMNLEAGLAASLSTKASDALNSAATTQAQLDLQASTTNAKMSADASAGAGKFFGSIGQSAGTALSTMLPMLLA